MSLCTVTRPQSVKASVNLSINLESDPVEAGCIQQAPYDGGFSAGNEAALVKNSKMCRNNKSTPEGASDDSSENERRGRRRYRDGKDDPPPIVGI